MKTTYTVKCTEEEMHKLFVNAIAAFKRRFSDYAKLSGKYKTYQITVERINETVLKRGIF